MNRYWDAQAILNHYYRTPPDPLLTSEELGEDEEAGVEFEIKVQLGEFE